MTIDKARKILGQRAERLTDGQILELIILLERICSNVIDRIVEKRR